MSDSTGLARRNWTEAEARVLVAIYFNANFSIGDDARYECRAIADAFGRTPSSIDRQWRNIQAVIQGHSHYNIGKVVRQSVQNYLNDPVGGTKLALFTCSQQRWDLQALVEGRELPTPPLSAMQASGDYREVAIAQVEKTLLDLEFRRFSSGSQGFYVQKRIRVQDGVKHQAQVSAVLIGSKDNPDTGVAVSAGEMAEALRPPARAIEQKTFSSGRSGFYASAKVAIREQRYQVSIQIVTLGGK